MTLETIGLSDLGGELHPGAPFELPGRLRSAHGTVQGFLSLLRRSKGLQPAEVDIAGASPAPAVAACACMEIAGACACIEIACCSLRLHRDCWRLRLRCTDGQHNQLPMQMPQ